MISITKPKYDLRNFKGGKLNNNIKYILIHDVSLEKSFVSVSIKAGSYYNPKDYEGLAHFLEHMLFMGSKKYPNENHFSQRLSELGGSSNAYTSVMETVYYFNVFDNGLSEMIDVFSRFFIDPLFDPDSVNREIKAIHSEHDKNINDDYWKMFQLELYLTDYVSHTNSFITGSLNTLNKPKIREKVIEFYKKYYNSDNISICIASSKPINEMKIIIDNTFGNIPKTKSQPFNLSKPFYNENKGNTYHLEIKSNIYELKYLWEIPINQKLIVLERLLMNNSEKSLLFFLKNKGYIKSIATETKDEGVFSLNFVLTKDGFDNWEYCDSALFAFLDTIKKSNINSYAKYYNKVLETNFNCLNKFETETLCNLLSTKHLDTKTEDVFQSIFLIKEIQTTDYYKKQINEYINSKNYIRIISSPTFSGQQSKKIEVRAYNAYYSKITTPPTRMQSINFELFNLDNEYLDADIVFIPNLDKYEIPTFVADRQWYGGCSRFGEPLVNIQMQFNHNRYYKNPENYILSSLSCNILNFLASTVLFKPSELCYSINFDASSTTNSININITANNNYFKLELFINQVQEFIFNIDKYFHKISKSFIDNLIESTADNFININFWNPWEYSRAFINSQIYETEYPINVLSETINSINYNKIKTYLLELFQSAALTTMIYGNIETINIQKLFYKFNSYFFNNVSPLPVIKQLNGFNIIHPNPNEKSNCITYFYPIGKFVPKEIVLLNIVVNILSQPFFDILRTKKQLGYLVRMKYDCYRNEFFITQKIQSTKSIKIIEKDLEYFNKELVKIIKKSNIDEFIQTYKNSLLEPDYSLTEKYYRYLQEINDKTYMFNRQEILLEQLNKITQNDLLDFTKKFINHKNRIQFIIHGN